jgi:hypothetical protein
VTATSTAFGTARAIWGTMSRPPAEAMLRAIAVHPRRSVDRCATVILVQTVLDPLPNIADHVVEIKLVRREGADRSGLCDVPGAAAAGAIA